VAYEAKDNLSNIDRCYDAGFDQRVEICFTVVMSQSDFVHQSSKIQLKPTYDIMWGIVEHTVVDMSRGKWNISLFSLCIIIFMLLCGLCWQMHSLNFF